MIRFAPAGAALAAAAMLAALSGAYAADATYVFKGYSKTLIRGLAQFGEMTEVCRRDFGVEARLCTPSEWAASDGVAAPQAASWIAPEAGQATGYAQCRTAPLRGLGLALFRDGRLVGISCDRFRPVTCCVPLRR
jgi:hypothetical protein